MENGPFGRLDFSNILPLNRPLLVARINKPSSQLVLDGISAVESAQINQTSLVRCLLPIEAENAAALINDNAVSSDLARNSQK
jgi:hypothetical protein